MAKLIVHADDFGLSETINEGILHAHLRGILTSTSLIANGAAFEHAIGICQSTPTLDVGVHLTLVEEEPVLDVDLLPSLVNGKGRFHHHATIFATRYLTGKVCLAEVHYELEAQIQKVIRRGVRVSHLDSHQHLHMLPQILRITVELAKHYGIPAIRFPGERMRVDMLRENKSVTRVFHLFVLNLLCCMGRNANTLRTDYFVGFFFGGRLHKKNLKKVLENIPLEGTCELMCHPGFDDPKRLYSHWGYHWSDELSALVDQDISHFLRHNGIELVSYRHLSNLQNRGTIV